MHTIQKGRNEPSSKLKPGVLESWQARLLQLDKRNNLLYFNEKSKTAVKLRCTDLDLLYRSISDAGARGLQFPFARQLLNSDQAVIIAGSIEAVNCEPVELYRRLSVLRRRDREWEEEQGTNVLYVAFGLLDWVDEAGNAAVAPIILLPADLLQASPRDPYFLSREPDEPVLNSTLNHYLLKLGWKLPSFDCEKPIADFLQECHECLLNSSFAIRKEAMLACFAYSKLGMWSDIQALNTSESKHPLLVALLDSDKFGQARKQQKGTGGLDFLLSGGGQLDELLSQRERHLILPADYSQCLAAYHAQNGDHLIIHGPPGTGKSQTIANLIGMFLADGKSVLFVSEKTAALDVVKRRLDRCGLGTFCLDLHSDRGKRSEAYEQIAQALCFEKPEQTTFFPSNRYKILQAKLNKVAQALHVRREPFNSNVFTVHGRLASLKAVPLAQIKVASEAFSVAQLSEERLDFVLSLCLRLGNHPKEFREHGRSFWNEVLRDNLSHLGLNERLQLAASALLQTVTSFRAAGDSVAATLGMSPPRTALELDKQLELGKLLLKSPWNATYPLEWMGTNRKAVRQLAIQQEQLSSKRRQINDSLGPIMEVLRLIPNQAELIKSLSCIQASERVFKASIGENWPTVIGVNGPALRDHLLGLGPQLDQAVVALRDLIEFERQQRSSHSDPDLLLDPVTLVTEAWSQKIGTVEKVLLDVSSAGSKLYQVMPAADCQHLLTDVVVCRRLLRETRENLVGMRRALNESRQLSGVQFHNWAYDAALFSWLCATLQRLSSWALYTVSPRTTKECLLLIRSLVSETKQLRLAERELEHLINLEIADHIDEDSIDRYLTVTSSRWRRLHPHYHWLRRIVTFNAKKHHSVTPEAISAILKQTRVVQRCRQRVAPLKSQLRLQVGHGDFDLASLQQLESELVDLNALFENDSIDLGTLESRLAEPANVCRIIASQKRLSVQADRTISSFYELLRLLSEKQIVNKMIEIRSRLTDIGELLVPALIPLRTVSPLLAHGKSIARITALLSHFSEAQSIEQQYLANLRALALQEECISWSSVVMCMDWLDQVIALMPDPDNLLPIERAIARTAELSENIRAAEQSRIQVVSRLNDLRRLVHLPWLNSKDPTFDHVTAWLQELEANAHSATDYLHYKVLVQTLESLLQSQVVVQVRGVTDDARLVTSVVEKFFLKRWLDWVYSSTPVLRDFDVKDHEKAIESFEELDKEKSPMAATQEIQRRLLERFPSDYAISCKSGECAALLNEIKKQRRRLPIRQLIERVPNVLRRIKPCFMMSPLAVSQYLPLPKEGEFLFDVLIFDEASQIFPEDAIPAISRCKQIIVVGDEQQLPPTNFFNRTSDSSDEDDEPGEERAIGASESILSGIKQLGTGVRECYLNMHYRSRDESLISFSNKNFYNKRLLTFPGSFRTSTTDGIRDCFVPGAVFDSGKTRRNALEAQRVVELVFEHFEKHGFERSLGVVALSRTQADFIHELIIEMRKQRPEFDKYFSEDEIEPFFVKNLENVQGDERDHIILCIGYGPPADGGKVPNRFGPINAAGGERRLNVAVSRARYTMTLVRSLQPSDIRSERTGPQLLKQFISYCELSSQGRQQQLNKADGGTDIFIDVVKKALEMRGYQVESFADDCNKPLDLAILSIDGKTYDVGLVIDGKSYYSAPTARDREWLRTSVLEDLGWRLFRLWSGTWLANPDQELDRIENVVRLAREFVEPHAPRRDSALSHQLPKPTSTYSQLLRDRGDSEYLLFQPYREASLAGCVRASDRWDSEVINDSTLTLMLLRLAQQEGPIHFEEALDRMRVHLNVGRIGHKIRARIVANLKDLFRDSKVRASFDKEKSPVFFWAAEMTSITPRGCAKGGVPRKIERIASEEIESGVLVVMHQLLVVETEDLIKEVAKQFGYNRTGADIFQSIRTAIKKLLKAEKLEEFGSLVKYIW